MPDDLLEQLVGATGDGSRGAEELEQEYLREFQLGGEEKDVYLDNLDRSIHLLAKADLPLKRDLTDIRAFLRALGENTDPLFETLSFDREDSGFPTYFQVIGLLSQKRAVPERLDRLNAKLLAELNPDLYVQEPDVPKESGTVPEQVAKRVERNAELLAQLTVKNVVKLTQSAIDTPEETLDELSALRARALFYGRLFGEEHLVDTNIVAVQSKRGNAFTMMRTGVERRDSNARFSKWRLHLSAFDGASDLFVRYDIDFYVQRKHQGDVVRRRGKGYELAPGFLSTADFYVGLTPEVIYDHLSEVSHVEPAEVTMYAIGPFYSGRHAHSEGKLPEDLLAAIRSSPEEYLLVATSTAVRRATRKVSDIFRSSDYGAIGEPTRKEHERGEERRLERLPEERAFYYVPSPGIEEKVRACVEGATVPVSIFDNGGGNFARSE